MSNFIQISDFFGEYPDVDDPLFNSKIASKAELRELEPDIFEPTPQRGQGYKNQRFMVRFLTWFIRMALYHEPGTGKSCIITHSAELFKNEFFKNPDDPTRINRAVILVKNKTLRRNIKYEITCKCTESEVFETVRVRLAKDEKESKAALRAELKKWYKFYTYGEFANILRNIKTQTEFDEFMSNVAVYVDEAHNIPIQKDIRSRRYIYTLEQAEEIYQEDYAKYERDYQRYLSRRERVLTAKEPDEPKFGGNNYENIFRAFHSGNRNVIVLATATPMTNSPIDIIPLQNLIQPKDKLLPNWTKEDFKNLTFDQIEPYFRGRVSYLRAPDTGAYADPQGVSVENFKFKLEILGMSKFQYTAYLNSFTRALPSLEGPEYSEKELSSFYDKQRHASNFVFPDGSFGSAGFKKYIEKVNNKYQIKRNNPDGDDLRDQIQDNLDYLSIKDFDLVQLCLDSYLNPGEEVTDNKGIVFAYFPDFVKGSGAIMGGISLELNGYEEFRGDQNIFENSYRTNQMVGICGAGSRDQESRTALFEPKKRYAFITGKTTEKQQEIILNTLNSYENRYGQYLQVVIASMVGGEGININNAVKQIMNSGSWNFSSYYQALQRVFRSTSHDIRLKEKREKYLQENPNATPEEIAAIKFPVETYNFASVYEGDPKDPEEIYQTDVFDTIDTQMYRTSEFKDREIRKVMRFIKQSSVDGYLNRKRNVRITDVDYSPECDYMQCDYQLAGMDESILKTIDRTNKILYYSEDEIQSAENAIKNLFSRFSTLKIDQIHKLLPQIDDIYIDWSLEKLIRTNEQMVDRMGFYGYLREADNEIIYLERDPFEVRIQPENTAYTSALIGIQDPKNNNFDDYLLNIQIIEEAPLIDQLKTMDPEDPKFKLMLDNLSSINKAKILESVYMDIVEGNLSPYTEVVSSYFAGSHYAIPEEPVNWIRQTAMSLAAKGTKQGRKPGPKSKIGTQKINIDYSTIKALDPDLPSETIYIHTIFNQARHEETHYGKKNKLKEIEAQMRLLKPSEQIGWRNLNEVEKIVYDNLISREISQILNQYDKFEIYGFITGSEGRMSIRDRASENPETRDARKITGKECKNWTKPKLFDLFYRLGINSNVQLPTNLRLDTMKNFLSTKDIGWVEIRTFPDDKIKHIYGWYQTGVSIDDICERLKQHFQATGRLFEGKITSSGPVPLVGNTQTSTPEVYEPLPLDPAVSTVSNLIDFRVVERMTQADEIKNYFVDELQQGLTQPPNVVLSIVDNQDRTYLSIAQINPTTNQFQHPGDVPPPEPFIQIPTINTSVDLLSTNPGSVQENVPPTHTHPIGSVPLKPIYTFEEED